MMPIWLQTAALLCCSNLFMTFAWYGHLKSLNGKPWLIAALISWGIAFFEYMLMVPANRIGYSELSIGQLKIMQEVITSDGFRAIQRDVHAAAIETGLSMGGHMPGRRGVLHISQLVALSL